MRVSDGADLLLDGHRGLDGELGAHRVGQFADRREGAELLRRLLRVERFLLRCVRIALDRDSAAHGRLAHVQPLDERLAAQVRLEAAELPRLSARELELFPDHGHQVLRLRWVRLGEAGVAADDLVQFRAEQVLEVLRREQVVVLLLAAERGRRVAVVGGESPLADLALLAGLLLVDLRLVTRLVVAR